MALETLKPQVPVDQDTDTVRGLEVLRDSKPNAELTYDESVSEWAVNDDLSVNGEIDAGGVHIEDTENSSGSFFDVTVNGTEIISELYLDGGTSLSYLQFAHPSNSNIAQLGVDAGENFTGLFFVEGFSPQDGQSSVKLSASEINLDFENTSKFTVGSSGVVNIADNNTQDTSGDLQIRDDSGGDLFSLDDGSSPQLAAKYEGSGAFTFGYRTGTTGNHSVVLNGQDSANFDEENIASGDASLATGYQTEASGLASYAGGFDTLASNYTSFAIGNITEASGFYAVASGTQTTASGDSSHASGNSTIASGRYSRAEQVSSEANARAAYARNRNTVASADMSSAIGEETVSRVFGGTVLGVYNEDYVGSGNETSILNNLSDSDRIFAVGAGDDGFVFDERGRLDGFYVTMRDGTYARHGFQVDRYNGSSYERELRIPETIQSGTDTSEILVRNPNTNEVEFVSDVDVASGAVSVESGADTNVTFNSSTGAFTVDVVAEGTEGEFQVKDADTSLGVVDSGTTAAYDSANGAFTFGVRGGATGIDSIVLGGSEDSSVSATASGKASTAMGLDAEATGLASLAGGTDTTASGDYSVAFGSTAEATALAAVSLGTSTASGVSSVALGTGGTASGDQSFVANFSNTASGDGSAAINERNEAVAFRSFAAGARNVSRMYAGTVVGSYNEDYLGSGNEKTSESFTDTDRMFAVGVGTGLSDRRDGLFVTYRDGTYARHGLQVDRYDGSQYVRELRIPSEISSGSDTTEVLVRNPSTNELEYVSAAQISSSGIDLSDGDNITTTFVASTGSTRIDAVASGSDGYVQVNDNGKFGVADSSDIAIRYHTNNAAFTAGARSGTVGTNSVVLNGSSVQTNQASGNLSLAVGGDTTASGSRSFAGGNLTVASGGNSVALGESTAAQGSSSTALGNATEAKPFGSLAVGVYNLLGQTVNSSIGDLVASSKMFTVGVGESGSREDGFWVSYGNGTYVRNGLTLPNAVPEQEVPDKILVRNPSTGRVEQTDPVDVVDTGIEVQSGDNITTSFNSSTGQTTVSVVAAGSTNDFQLNDGSGLGVVTGTPVARYEGSGAFTFGHRSGTTSANSVVMGGEDGNENEASGDVSVALGRTTTATGDYAFVAGNNNTSSATASTAFGQNTTASGDYALASGRFALASGPSALAVGDQVDATGDQSVALGNSTTASSVRAVATGSSTTASGNNSTAMGFDTTASGTSSAAIGAGATASGDQSIALNNDTTASGFHATALGFNAISRVYGGSALGLYNEDNVGAGSEPGSINNLSVDNKTFAVGVGDDPNSSPGNNNYFDGRGRVDGLYVTMRDGTYIRHGLQIDTWNGSSYEKTLRIGSTIPEGSGGQVLIRNPNTNDLEYIKADDLVAEGVNVSGGKNISTRYNSSTDEFIVDLDEDRLVERESITSGALQVQGDNHSIDYSLNQRTTTGTQTTMAVDSQGLNKLPSAQNDATWRFRGEVVARVEENTNSSLSNASKGDSHVWEFEGVFSTEFNPSTGINETRFIGSPVVSTISTDVAVSDYEVTVTATDGELEVNVQAEDGATVNWTARLEVVELVA